MGRPSTYKSETAEHICKEIASGETLRAICRRIDIPESTVRQWVMDDHEGFYAQYARARELQVEAWADLIVSEAEDSSKDTLTLTRRDGSKYEAPDHEWINRSRLRVDTYKWLMSKIAHKKYGDKLDLNNTLHAGDTLLAALDKIATNAHGK